MLALPGTLQYDTKSTSAIARSYTSNLQPSGALSDYKPGSTVNINIPTSFNTVLCGAESVLKFNLRMDDTAAKARFDSCGAHGIIKTIRIYHGSNLLEDLDEYNLFAKEMFDLQLSNDSIGGKYSILCGTRPDLYNSTNNVLLKNMNTGAIIKSNADNYFCITLLSLLGSMGGSKYFPLFAATSAPVRMEITFVQSVQHMCCTTSTNTGFTVNDIEFLASYMELSDSAMSGILSSSIGGVFSYNTVGVRNYQDTMTTPLSGNIQKNMVIPARFSSVKSLLVSMRDSNRINQVGYYPLGTFKFGLNQYNFRIGSNSSIPTKAPNNVQNYFYELLKCVNTISNVNHQPSIDLESYDVNTPGETAQVDAAIMEGNMQSGSFYIGLNCENFPNSDTTNFYSGLNTTNDDITCMLSCTGSDPSRTLRLDAFATFDQGLRFENGVAYVTF